MVAARREVLGRGQEERPKVQAYRVVGQGKPGEAQPCRPVHSRTPLAVTQHLPVAGDVLSRIVKVAREVDEAELGKRRLLLPPRKLSEEKCRACVTQAKMREEEK